MLSIWEKTCEKRNDLFIDFKAAKRNCIYRPPCLFLINWRWATPKAKSEFGRTFSSRLIPNDFLYRTIIQYVFLLLDAEEYNQSGRKWPLPSSDWMRKGGEWACLVVNEDKSNESNYFEVVEYFVHLYELALTPVIMSGSWKVMSSLDEEKPNSTSPSSFSYYYMQRSMFESFDAVPAGGNRGKGRPPLSWKDQLESDLFKFDISNKWHRKNKVINGALILIRL